MHSVVLAIAISFVGFAVQAQSFPEFLFFGMNGAPVTHQEFKLDQPTIVVLFDPSCEHCQQQAKWLSELAGEFSGIQFVYVSTASFTEIKTFKEIYLRGLNVKLLRDSNYKFDDYFGDSPVPSMYIYSSGGNLLKSYKGEEVPAVEILSLLNG